MNRCANRAIVEQSSRGAPGQFQIEIAKTGWRLPLVGEHMFD